MCAFLEMAFQIKLFGKLNNLHGSWSGHFLLENLIKNLHTLNAFATALASYKMVFKGFDQNGMLVRFEKNAFDIGGIRTTQPKAVNLVLDVH
jgi:hypothetical protein